MTINFTMSRKEYHRLEQLVKEKAIENSYGTAWFESIEEFEDWAGDVFWDLLDETLMALGIKVEDDEE